MSSLYWYYLKKAREEGVNYLREWGRRGVSGYLREVFVWKYGLGGGCLFRAWALISQGNKVNPINFNVEIFYFPFQHPFLPFLLLMFYIANFFYVAVWHWWCNGWSTWLVIKWRHFISHNHQQETICRRGRRYEHAQLHIISSIRTKCFLKGV